MGQRTNLIVEETLVDKEGKFIARKVFLYHDQWGYGEGMLKDAMSYILAKNSCGFVNKYGDHDENSEIQAPEILFNAFLINNEYQDEPARLKVLETTPINTVQDVQDIIHGFCDNNNGAIVLKITRDRFGYIQNGRYMLFKGSEDCEEPEVAFSRVISLSEYEKIWDFTDKEGKFHKVVSKEIISAFRSLCRYYEIKADKLGTRKPKDPSYADRLKEIEQKMSSAITPQL